MSENSDAFDELLDVQEECLGRREKLILNGQAVDFLVGDTNTIDSFVGGGIAQSGSYVGMVRLADWNASGAEKYAAFVFRDANLQVLNFQQINDTMQVTGGDPTAGEP